MLRSDVVFDFSKDPWFSDIVLFLKDKMVIDEKLFDKPLTRRDAMVFVNALVKSGLVNTVVLYSDAKSGFSFKYPVGLIGTENSTGSVFLGSDIFVQTTGIQRVAFGLYTASVVPNGLSVNIPDGFKGKLRDLKKFESCDSATLNCQIAYFYTLVSGKKYFIEVSYVSEKSVVAKPLIDAIYDSIVIIDLVKNL